MSARIVWSAGLIGTEMKYAIIGLILVLVQPFLVNAFVWMMWNVVIPK